MKSNGALPGVGVLRLIHRLHCIIHCSTTLVIPYQTNLALINGSVLSSLVTHIIMKCSRRSRNASFR